MKKQSVFLSAIMVMAAASSASPNSAEYISQSVPTSVTAGSNFNVSIIMKNTGTKTWTTSYGLGPQNPRDNYTWGRHRVYLTNNVAPGSDVTFNFTATAPTTPGNYNFQWRILEEMVEWFGDLTPNVVIAVGGPSSPLFELSTIPKGLGVNVPGRGAEYVRVPDEAGLKFIRMDFSWSSVEQQKGVYDFAIYDAQVEEASKRNVGIIYILDYENKLYCSDKSCQTDAERNAFAAFASAAAARYAGKKILWEIWNEPNGNFWSPQPSDDAYTKLVEVTAPRIRAADPSAVVLAPSMSRFTGQWGWLENCFKKGLLNWIDAVTVHPYRNARPEDVISDYDRLRSLINTYAPGKNIPIISGEWGYSLIPEGEPRITEEQQAQYLARMFLVNLYQGIPLSIWYCIYNGPDPDGPDARERNFGLIKWDGTKKPNYFAAQTICQKLAGYSYYERLDVGSGDDYVLKLRKGQNEALAMWTVGGSHKGHIVTLPIAAGKGTLIQMLGKESSISWGSSGLTLGISQSPQYLLIGAEDTTPPAKKLGH